MAIPKIRKISKISKISTTPKVKVGADFEPITKSTRFVISKQKSDEEKLEAYAADIPDRSLPERLVYTGLIELDLSFETETDIAGGRFVMGGSVSDFIVYGLLVQAVVLRVQGDYWHGPQFPMRQLKDDEQRDMLIGQGYIVVDLWEWAIYEAVLEGRLPQFIEDEIFAAI